MYSLPSLPILDFHYTITYPNRFKPHKPYKPKLTINKWYKQTTLPQGNIYIYRL